MNLAIIGYGKMGKMIEEIAIQRGHSIVAKWTSKDYWNAQSLIDTQTDVAIEFTTPHAVVKNILTCFDANIPVVVGTTGWYTHLKEIEAICLQKNQTLLYASNFSIGVHLFFKISNYVASVMNAFTNYDVQIIEVHHTQKKDAPSGTAISLAEQILKHYPQKKQWTLQKAPNTLHITAHRCNDEKGFHAIHYISDVDTIQLVHRAYSRKGFAMGAILAAEFIQNKKGIFQMKDVLNIP